MTQAYGDAWIEFHGDMDDLDRDVEREADQIRRDDKGQFKRAGKGIGDTMGDAASEQFASHARDFGRRLQEEVRRRPIRVKQKVDVDYDIDSHRLGAEIHEAVSEAFAPGGPVDTIGRKFGMAVGDAFGAGFGISGRSALIPFIIVLVGAIVALVVAAIQAVNALIAVLTTIPAVLTSILLQVGVVVLAFQGMGTAISGAFAAKNAKELDEAIKGLTPSAREFVRTLLPLRDLFDFLKKQAQEGFFKGLGDVISRIQEAIGPTFGFNIGILAEAMGRFVRELGLIFADPIFVKLLNDLIPATINWLEKFGPGFANFLLGLVKLADSSMPFLNKLGESLSGGLSKFGDFLKKLADDPEFQKWLQDMLDTLKAVGDLFMATVGFVKEFMKTLDEEGGTELIKKLAEAFITLKEFFESETGHKAMRGFVTLLELMVGAITFLILAFFYIIAAVREFILWIKGLKQDIEDFVERWGFLLEWSQVAFTKAWDTIKATFSSTVDTIKGYWHSFQTAVSDRVGAIVETAKALPGRIKDALGNFKDLLLQKGKDLVQGLIDGIKSMFGALGNAASQMIKEITNKLPGSPAKEGPLSGSGAAMIRGQHLVQDLAKGIQIEIPAMRSSTENMVNNIMFGPGAVSVRFDGVVPTPEQARVTGAAAGQGLLDQLAARDVRLAVRTL